MECIDVVITAFLILCSVVWNGATSVKFTSESTYKIAQGPYGQSFICVDINSQPSFEHPLLRNHTIQMKPSSVPARRRVGSGSIAHLGANISSINCPPRTIPIPAKYAKHEAGRSIPWFKTDMSSENHFSHRTAITIARESTSFYGCRAAISVYQPKLGIGKFPRFSGAIFPMQNGTPPNASSLYAGWFVDRHFYRDDHAHLEVGWSDKGGRYCTNHACPGFVQVSSKITPGSIIRPVSVIGGTQYEIRLQVFQDAETRNWWLTFGWDDHQVGYWPGEIIPYMFDSAAQVGWGGVVQAATGEFLPPMGSGGWPVDGRGRVAYIADIEVVVENASKQRVSKAPNEADLYNKVSDPECYHIGPLFGSGDSVGFLFGGPGCLDAGGQPRG